MEIISIANIKGGVGKTTTGLSLAAEMAKQGHKTLLIDNDAQANLTQILNIGELEETLYDIYVNEHLGFNDVIYDVKENLYLIPNDIRSAQLDTELALNPNRETLLKDKIRTIPKVFDFVIIDNSPSMSISTRAAFYLSDYYICVVDNSASSLRGYNMLNSTIDELKSTNSDIALELLGILRSRFDKRTRFSKQFHLVLQEAFKDQLFKTVVWDSVKYKESSAMHMCIQDYNKTAAAVYTSLYKEIKERI